ncbi:hypothetical protein PT974_07614 [Cladobotryum mycophilum]|uniref:Uncharacterized protein n=1 Tax=Cladobotryum mycophilum TaxID=491253 RepID=A0ABR0SQI6_9HYPO
MLFIQSLIVAAFAVAQSSASVIFTEPDFQGINTVVSADAMCTKLTGPFVDNVHSVVAGDHFKCELYFDFDCANLAGTYYQSEYHLADAPYKAIRCLRDSQ